MKRVFRSPDGVSGTIARISRNACSPTRPMLVNDDLGAFTDFAAAIGRRVADFENATAYGLLNAANGDGPTLTTGNAPVSPPVPRAPTRPAPARP